MMKVSDPIMFGLMVKVYYKDVFAKHGDLFKQLRVNVNNGLGDIYDKIKEDTSKFLSVTQKITKENKQEWILLMEQSQQNNNCMGKTQRKKMYTLWNNFNI